MFRCRSLIACLLIVALRTILPAAQKPQVVVPLPSEGRGAAGSVKELWDRSDAVLEGRIKASRPADYKSGDTEMVYTMYAVEVIAAFKDTSLGSSIGKTIQVRRPGGIRDRGQRIEKHEAQDFPQFEIGSTVIMFLRHKATGASDQNSFYYGTAYDGPQSFYDTSSSTEVKSRGRDRVSVELNRMSPQALRAQLKNLGGGR